MMIEAAPTIVVIDDDPEVRESLGSRLRSIGLQVKLSASVPEFLQTGLPARPAWCLTSGCMDAADLIFSGSLRREGSTCQSSSLQAMAISPCRSGP
jgi:FixJ family two-component response regulator